MDSLAFNLFCPYQLGWGADPAGVRLAEKSRRIGWTYFDAFDSTINRVGPKPARSYDCWYSATDMTAAEEYIGYVAEFAAMVAAVAKVSDGEIESDPDETGSTTKIKVMRATFESGVRITAGSSNPNFFRSKGGEVKLDELAFHRDGKAMVKAALASARFWGFPLSAWSSHHGPTSYFNQLIKQARTVDPATGKQAFKASVHSVNILQAVEQGIVERVRMRRERLTDIPAVDEKYRQEWIDERRAECPDADVWNEEFMCIPSTDAGAFLDYDLIRRCEVSNLQLWSLPSSANAWPEGRTIYAGCDVAVRSHLFVLWAIEKVGDTWVTRMIEVRRGATFAELEQACDRLLGCKSVKRLCLDATGLGMMLAENLKRKWGHRFEAVTFNAGVKLDLAMPLRRVFEDVRIRVPNDDAIREDLHAVRKVVTSAGNIRFEADESADGHADRFWALALAYHAAEGNTPQGIVASSGRKPVGC